MKVLSNTLIHASRFRYSNRWLLFARARLYEDRIELTGLSWSGIRRQVIFLDAVRRIYWWAGRTTETNLVLDLQNGEQVELIVPGAGVWGCSIESHAPRLEPAALPVPEVEVPAA